VIASLIYQHCTGKRQDLERACEDVLRRGGGWTWNDPIPQALFDDMEKEYWAWLRAGPDFEALADEALVQSRRKKV